MLLELLKTLGVLLGVLGLIVGLAVLWRKLSPAGLRGDSHSAGWRVLGVKMLGPKRQIYILEVGSRILLIGASDKGLTTLLEIHEEKECEAIREALSGHGRSLIPFQDWLRKAES